MAKYTNISNGPRGAYLKGVLVFADPGETIDADDAPKEWFKGGKASDDDGDDGEKSLAQLNKAELLEVAAAEGVEVEDGATNAAIREAIEAKRAAA